ncbi:hypothetical protein HDU98_009827 [Podochytrium sp. JEL0797]|nr:hypothetical protein HDU98_009827 [Podochytrium sp. JEL0797]
MASPASASATPQQRGTSSPVEDRFRLIECITDRREHGGTVEYLVKWGDDETFTWVAREDISNCDALVAAFEEENDQDIVISLDNGNSDSDDEVIPVKRSSHVVVESDDEVADSNDGGDSNTEADSTTKSKAKRPINILRKFVETKGRVVFKVVWSDGSQSLVNLKDIKDPQLKKLVEEFYNKDEDEMDSDDLSVIDTRPTRRSTRSRRADSSQDEESSENSTNPRRQTRSSAGSRGSKQQQQPTRRASRRSVVVEESSDEGSRDSEESVDAVIEISNDDENEEDEEDEDSGSESEVKARGGKRAFVLDQRANGLRTHQEKCNRCGMGSDNRRRKDADLMGASGPLLPCSTCASQIHQNCSSKPSRKDRTAHDAHTLSVGYKVTDFQCADCFPTGLPSCELCHKLPRHREPDSEEDEVSSNLPSGIQTPVSHGEGVDTPTSNAMDVDNASNADSELLLVVPPRAATITAPTKKPKTLNSTDVTPLFRCQRCKLTAHVSCLVKQYPASMFKELNDAPTSRKGSAGSLAFYTDLWTCFECCRWNSNVETILTFRDVSTGAVASSSESVSPTANATFTREYFVKFQGLSHRWNEWVPARWIEGQKTCAAKLGNFLRDKEPAWQKLGKGHHAAASSVEKQASGLFAKPVEGVVNEDWVRAEKILDVRMAGSKSGVKSGSDVRKLDLDDVEMVLVKWCGLGYANATWERIPIEEMEEDGDDINGDEVVKRKLEVDMIPSFVDAFEGWKRRNSIGVSDKKRTTIVGKPRFTEYKEQPGFIKGGVLKDYQLDGLNWLMFKWLKGIPSILADEMGLGKTVQIVSVLNALFTEHNLYPFLILAPSITIGHWLDEFAKWAPEMVAVHYTGEKTDREMIREHEIFAPRNGSTGGGPPRFRFHVMICNYEMMMNESSLFRTIPFAAMACDEGHRLKNDESKTFRSLMENIQVKHKIVLSGTPLQNNMRELFNLMNFLDPEQWSDPKDLASRFGIENIKDDASIIPKIHEFLRPYFLRRTKKEVLTFLPPKAELVVPVHLTHVQKELYKAVLAKNFSLLRSIGVNAAGEKAAAPLKNILMELRKICNHPYLASSSNLEPPGTTTAADLHQIMVDCCGKFALLQPMLRKLKDGGHRVLLFSQFKIALDIIEDFLEGEGYKYQRIDGDTPTSSRHAMIGKFNEPNSEDFIFLLTTRTGGTGINLTSADTVIIYDSDWNPHQDIQAVARVHRIGQTKPVLIYKLCTMDTIEQSVLERSTSKLVLDKIVVGAMKEEDNVNTKELSSILKIGAKKLFEEATAAPTATDESGAPIPAPVAAVPEAHKYDEAAVAKLLDRDAIIAEEVAKVAAADKAAAESAEGKTDETESATGGTAKPFNFSFAKIWTHEVDEQSEVGTAAGGEESVQDASEEGDTDFWDKLLKDRLELARQEEESVFLGKRQRKSVNYSEKMRRASGKGAGAEEEEVDELYEPEDDDGPSDEESASEAEFSDADEADGDEFGSALTFDKEWGIPWLPWMTDANNMDPMHVRPQKPNEPNSDILKCWLCLQQNCRYRTQCEKAKNVVS